MHKIEICGGMKSGPPHEKLIFKKRETTRMSRNGNAKQGKQHSSLIYIAVLMVVALLL